MYFKRLEEMIKEIKSSKDSKGNKWLINHDLKQSFNFEDKYNQEDIEIREIINKFFDKNYSFNPKNRK